MTTVPPRPDVFGSAPSGTTSGPATPTAEVVAKRARRTARAQDSLGRWIAIRWLSPLERMRLARILGKDASNEVYMGYAALAATVTHIDDDEVSVGTVREIEFIIERLGEEGLECIGDMVAREFPDLLKGPDKDAAKNS